MKHGSLFSGIGGFDLAAQWMGWENVFHCEWNEFGQRVLNYYWPNAISYGDITKTDFTVHAGQIDILTGGFPCQPYSAAGKRMGKEDDRHLWPEMLRSIREIHPRWVVGENVLGLVNWNAGLVFHEVQLDLEAEGYEVQPYVLPACSVNAPHRRDRVWFVAHCANAGVESVRRERKNTVYRFEPTPNPHHAGTLQPVRDNGNGAAQDNGRERQPQPEPGQGGFSAAHTVGNGYQSGFNPGEGAGTAGTQPRGKATGTVATGGVGNWDRFPTQPPVRQRNDGFSPELAGITVSKHRNESIKAYGNAIVPQVALQIFKAIQQYENKSNAI